MATRSYTLQMGTRIPVVAEGPGSAIAGVNGDGVQLTVEFSSKMRRADLLEMLGRLEAHILQSKWPAA
jgi:hypothetical protein